MRGLRSYLGCLAPKWPVLLASTFWIWNPPKSTFFGWFQNGTTDHAAPKRGPSRVGFRFLFAKRPKWAFRGAFGSRGIF